MRGEHAVAAPLMARAAGSSPHARGAHVAGRALGPVVGLIPACAGSTRICLGVSPRPWAHPRMRGEHDTHDHPAPNPHGSSPHARGARLPHLDVAGLGRLIPACAGSTRHADQISGGRGAHPRMRGEHRCVGVTHRHPRGSSPHARGARLTTRGVGGSPRLIPACAGSTKFYLNGTLVYSAHPRMRGEHTAPPPRARARAGSSPHARGALPLLPCRGPLGRLIPACAGSTGEGRQRLRERPAHPRMRGEHSNVQVSVRSPPGSSPHARGAHHPHLIPRELVRLIPACAGSTLTLDTGRAPHRAHPRMRGEHRPGLRANPRNSGSSPHARGAHNPVREDLPDPRLIPACAGSTAANSAFWDS